MLFISGCATMHTPPPTAEAPTVEEFTAAQRAKLEQAAMREIVRKAPEREGSYRIARNDVVEISVFAAPEWDRTARVGADGIIRVPPLGEITVLGMTERELEQYLQDQLREKQYLKQPQVTVIVTETHPSEVYLFGAVGSPGAYPLMEDVKLLELFAAGGGIGAGAGTTAYVIRYDESMTPEETVAAADAGIEENRITIDLEGLLIRGEPEWNISLWPGDVVNVPVPDPGWVHVTGPGIVNPGTYPLITFLGLQGREVSPSGAQSLVPFPLTRSSKSLRQAIDEAGGLLFEANRRVLVLRETESGERKYIHVNYKKILRDTRNDVPLQTRDTVVVNYHPVRYVIGTTIRIVQQVIRVGVSLTYDLNDDNDGGSSTSGGGSVVFIE